MRTDPCVQRFTQPIGICAGGNCPFPFGISLFIPYIITRQAFILIQSEIPLQLQFFSRIQQIVRGQVRSFDIDPYFCINAQFTGFRLLCRHHNHSVRTPRTVYRRSSSIFQDIDRFDFLVVIVHQTLQCYFKAIQDDQRGIHLIAQAFVILLYTHRQRRITPDIHLRHPVGIATVNIIHSQINGHIYIFQCLKQILAFIDFQLLLIDR